MITKKLSYHKETKKNRHRGALKNVNTILLLTKKNHIIFWLRRLLFSFFILFMSLISVRITVIIIWEHYHIIFNDIISFQIVQRWRTNICFNTRAAHLFYRIITCPLTLSSLVTNRHIMIDIDMVWVVSCLDPHRTFTNSDKNIHEINILLLISNVDSHNFHSIHSISCPFSLD